MKEFNIAIRSFREVQDFVSLATVQLVNAKSFIGMVSLDYSRPLKVLCECDSDAIRNFMLQAGNFLM